MRTRIKKRGAVLACTAAGSNVKRNTRCPIVALLFVIVVNGLSIYQGSKEDCDDLCMQLRMKNQPAEVVRWH